MALSKNAAEFKRLNQRLRAIAALVGPEIAKPFQDGVAFSGLGALIRSTPVDTGRARSGWQATVGVTPSAEFQSPDPEGAGRPVIAAAPPFSSVRITNNVPHIGVLEVGGFVPQNPGPSRDPRPDRRGRILVRGGYSVQAPAGMLINALQAIKVHLSSRGGFRGFR